MKVMMRRILLMALVLGLLCSPLTASANISEVRRYSLIGETTDFSVVYGVDLEFTGKQIKTEVELWCLGKLIHQATASGFEKLYKTWEQPLSYPNAVYIMKVQLWIDGKKDDPMTWYITANPNAYIDILPFPLHISSTEGAVWVGNMRHDYYGVLSADEKLAQIEFYCAEHPSVSTRVDLEAVIHYDGLYYTNTAGSSQANGLAAATVTLNAVNFDSPGYNGATYTTDGQPWYVVGRYEVLVSGGRYENYDFVVARNIIDFRNDYDNFAEPLR